MISFDCTIPLTMPTDSGNGGHSLSPDLETSGGLPWKLSRGTEMAEGLSSMHKARVWSNSTEADYGAHTCNLRTQVEVG